MSVNLDNGIIPFTELYERLMSLAKIDTFNNRDYAKGLINDAYIRVLPSISDWSIITEESFITTVAPITDGACSGLEGSTTITLVGSTVWNSSVHTKTNGWKLLIDGSTTVFNFTAISTTQAIVEPALDTELVSNSYILFKDEYSLPNNFDRFLRNGSIYTPMNGRNTDVISETPRDKFRIDFNPIPSPTIKRCLLVGLDANGNRKVRVNPPPDSRKAYPMDYIPKIAPMREYCVGTVDVTKGSAVITGNGTVFTSNVVEGMYFRVNIIGTGDSSKWYKILSVDSDTQITIDTPYIDNDETMVEFAICNHPTKFPSEFHEFILIEGVALAGANQTDPNTEVLIGRRGEVLDRLLSRYKTRRTNQQFKVDDDGYR